MCKRNITKQRTGVQYEQQQYCVGILVLNDHGGGVMHVSYDVTSTLRSQTKHHEPVVLVYESHGQDARYRPLGETCETISAKYGLGGGNQPIVLKYEETVQQS